MHDLGLESVAAANEAWVLEMDGSEVVETSSYRLVRFPDRFPWPLQLQWVRSVSVLDEIVARAAQWGPPDLNVTVSLGAPDGLEDELLARGAELSATGDILALPADLKAPDGLDLLWAASLPTRRDANTIATAVFGGSPAPDDVIAAQTETRSIVAYVDHVPVGFASLEVVDGVARLSGGAVLERHRGRGLYRALVAARLEYAASHGATMALTRGGVKTSSPILRRLGFVAYGQERIYRLPL